MSNNKSILKVIRTSDGTATLFDSNLNENYHSTHGALQESNHVYIEHGLKLINKTKVEILEVGLGTGLNAVLTLNYALSFNTEVKYSALEPFPISLDIMTDLLRFYPSTLASKMNLLANLEWEIPHLLHKNFTFKKILTQLQTFNTTDKFNLIYFDAFAPNKQPEMWTLDIFVSLYEKLNPGGILVTYCAQGQVKRNLKSAGFIVKSYPGPPGKREITVAFKA